MAWRAVDWTAEMGSVRAGLLDERSGVQLNAHVGRQAVKCGPSSSRHRCRSFALGHDGLRILVLAAVKNDYALVASAVGPYHEFSPRFGNGHPSGANLQLALDMAKYVNSFVWRGDSPR